MVAYCHRHRLKLPGYVYRPKRGHYSVEVTTTPASAAPPPKIASRQRRPRRFNAPVAEVEQLLARKDYREVARYYVVDCATFVAYCRRHNLRIPGLTGSEREAPVAAA